jgi:hypothetical protein
MFQIGPFTFAFRALIQNQLHPNLPNRFRAASRILSSFRQELLAVSPLSVPRGGRASRNPGAN